MEAKFCQECGTQLVLKELEHEGMVPFCTHCNQFKFPQYNVAVSMIVINEENDNVLLIQQYGKKAYILVAGYVNKGEELEEAARRELKEETGMEASRVIYNRSKFFEPSNTLMCNFTVFVKNTESFLPNYEIDIYHWYTKAEAKVNIKQNSLASYFLNSYLDENENI